jgi:hypothetical protein
VIIKTQIYIFKENKDKFNWFDHGWSHLQPHLINNSILLEQLLLNYNFALKHGIPVDSFYSVSSHHSGIYPVDDKLYELWSDVLLIKATSTETYPHTRPVHSRKGFIYKNIMVLPRQSLGVYTHTNFFNEYKNSLGELNLLVQVQNGDVFKSMLFNRCIVFMTHMTNYANDRLALFVLKNLFDFLTKWTNLNFFSLPPVKMAEKYFQLYPENKEPLWTNPCTDRKQLPAWSLNGTHYCSRFPKLLIIGPQKTGTTALLTYLNVHPNFQSNRATKEHFEETQFFTDEMYSSRGIDWYIKLFDHAPIKNESSSSLIFFEKSANYFTEFKAPNRIKKLLENDVKFVIIALEPAQRAYSWYQVINLKRFLSNSSQNHI